MASHSHVLVYHGPLQIATFWELSHLLSPQCTYVDKTFLTPVVMITASYKSPGAEIIQITS